MSAPDPRLARIAELRREAALDRLLGKSLAGQEGLKVSPSSGNLSPVFAAGLLRQADLVERLAGELQAEIDREREEAGR